MVTKIFTHFPGSALQGYFFVCCWFSSPFFYVPLFSGYHWRDHSGKLLVLVSWLCAEETGGAESWRSLSRAEQIKVQAVGRHTALWPLPWPWPPGWPRPPGRGGEAHRAVSTDQPWLARPLPCALSSHLLQRSRGEGCCPGGESALLRTSMWTDGLLVCFLIT